MALGSESEAEKVTVNWEVGPTKDVVLALMETLLDPALPYTVSDNDPPSIEVQHSVAKQMHAVVVLYNYYHRKLKPDLEFLDFISFSKLALSLRLTLTTFMKMTIESESTVVDISIDRLSVTEKAIKNACDISTALDASRDCPFLERWSISKVAVLVIDSKGENGFIQFGAVTEGVWSFIEKELNEDEVSRGILADERVGRKRKSIIGKAVDDDSKYLQIAYDVVKDISGIDRFDLVVSETHVTYSLTKEKSAAQFYVMHYRKPFSTDHIVSLKFLIESLQGPLAKKYDDTWTTVTDFVDYYQMLPYLRFISSWLLGKDLCSPISKEHNSQSTELTQSRVIAPSPRSEYRENLLVKWPSRNTVTDENVSKKLNKRTEMADSVKQEKNSKTQIFDHDDYEYLKCSLTGSSRGKNSKAKVNDAHGPNDIANVLKSKDMSGVTVAENPLPLVRLEALNNIEIKNKPGSEDLQNALALIYRKRQELCSEICTKEDELAIYEDCIQRIRDGGEVALARKCIKSIINGNDNLLPENGIQVLDNPTKLSEVFLPGRSSCQDLEYICLKNNWRLPRYLVEPSDSKYLSNVVVVGSEIYELCCKGGLEDSPCEARESAAAKMIARLRH